MLVDAIDGLRDSDTGFALTVSAARPDEVALTAPDDPPPYPNPPRTL